MFCSRSAGEPKRVVPNYRYGSRTRSPKPSFVRPVDQIGDQRRGGVDDDRRHRHARVGLHRARAVGRVGEESRGHQAARGDALGEAAEGEQGREDAFGHDVGRRRGVGRERAGADRQAAARPIVTRVRYGAVPGSVPDSQRTLD